MVKSSIRSRFSLTTHHYKDDIHYLSHLLLYFIKCFGLNIPLLNIATIALVGSLKISGLAILIPPS